MNEIVFLLQFLFVSFFLFLSRKRFNLLVALVAISLFIANFIVIKQISLFGLNSMGSELFVTVSFIGLFITQEVWGKPYGHYATLGALILVCGFVILSQLHLAYEPAVFDTLNTAYYEVFHFAPQVFFGSSLAFTIAALIGLVIFDKISNLARKPSLPVRMATAFVPAQILDTILFILSGLYGLTHNSYLFTVFGSFILKMVVFTLCIPFLTYIEKELAKENFQSTK